MNLLERISQAFTGAAETVGEKTRRSAALNRLRTVIDAQEKAAQREYLALGRYYYNNLRDPKDPVAEAHAVELDAILARQDKALTALEEFYQYEGPTEAFFAENDQREEVDLQDVKKFDFDPEKAVETVKTAAGKAAEAMAPVLEAAKEKAGPVVEAVKEKAAPVVEAAKEKAAPVVEAVKEKAGEVLKAVQEAKDKVAQEAEEDAKAAEEAVDRAVQEVEETLKQAENAAPDEGKDLLYSKIEPEKKEAEADENADLPFEG